MVRLSSISPEPALMIEALAAAIAGKAARRQARQLMRFDAGPVEWPPRAVSPERVRQLYIHIPFCPHLCPFCTFHRVRFQADRIDSYYVALRRELAWYHERGFRFTRLYVGGGTPTVDVDALASLLDDVRRQFPVNEISVETNPRDLTEPVLQTLERAGINRLSVGVQSFDDDQLHGMGRYDTYGSGDQIRERLAATQGRFDTLNIDMMFNLPGQTPESLGNDLETLANQLVVDQISYYPLMVAPVARQSIRSQMARGHGKDTAGREREYYRLIRETLTPTYNMGSVWCFTRGVGAIDEYIVDEEDYVGVGSGSFSYVAGVAASTTFSIHGYQERMANGRSPVVQARQLDPAEQMRYDLLAKLFGLNMDKSAIERKYDGRFAKTLRLEILALRIAGALRDTGPGYALGKNGMYLWVVLMREFLTAVNNLRADMRHNIRNELRELEVEPE
jgi:coproporphyrinogen III oxidase-like Fe-S oxidoreductase